MRRELLVVAMVLFPALVRGEVLDVSTTGFTLRHQVQIPTLTPEQVWPLLADQIGHWWDGAHSYSGEARHLQLEAVAGGCFCERYATGSVVHGTVINAQAPRLLRLSSALGPLQETASSGVLTWTLKPLPQGTELSLDYVVGGYRMGGLAEWARPVDGVLGQQMQRFLRYAATGKAAPPAP